MIERVIERMPELSASALQIMEKKERMESMRDLAEEMTINQIHEILKQKPNIMETQLVSQIKNEGIPILAFIHEYIKSKYAVSFNIAKGYFETFSEALEPSFIGFNPHGKPKPIHFHLTESTIKYLFAKIRANPKKR